ncbi:DNA-directed RNA polymerase I subunit RPA43 [Colossoma macropomum]|uniref:DNA-directed RNA polymerase I subunit RPA43 n=1 Tax=Colossoma macropomum TaxID=42526 RepID=UPI001863CCB1|nr:DNA-directed RNA polymerase I subunit RPA43 [Colossoma macropomum]
MANSKASDEDPKRAAVSAGVSAALSPPAGGGAVASPCLLPTFAEACALVQAPYSCLVMDTSRRHVALPPMYLKKKRTGIQEELNAELLKYSSSLKGVPLAYDHIKVLEQHGDILDDQGFIHLNIEASFVVFKPRKGEKLVGVINKIAVGHVGCLVHGCFNACVLKPAQLTPDQWRDSGLMVGGSLEFEVFQLDADAAGVLLIKGRLEKHRVQQLVASFGGAGTEEQGENMAKETATEMDSATAEEATESTSPSKPKKKKKKREKEMDTEAVEDINSNQAAEAESHDVNSNGMEVDPDSSIHTEEKKKKKKKKKDKRQEANEELPSPTELPNSDSSGYVSDKSSRKRKAQDDEGLCDHSDTPVVKKKKSK